MKKSIKLTLWPALSLLMIGFLWLYIVKPKLTELINEKIDEINLKQKYVKINQLQINVSLIKLQLEVQNLNLNILPEVNLNNQLTSSKLVLSLDPFKLLIGQIESTSIKIFDLNVSLDKNIFNSNNKESLQQLDLSNLFKILPQIPIRKVILIQSKVQLEHDNLLVQLSQPDDEFLVYNNIDHLELNAEKIKIKYRLINDLSSEMNFDLNVRGKLFENKFLDGFIKIVEKEKVIKEKNKRKEKKEKHFFPFKQMKM